MTLYREITDEERRTWSATRFQCLNVVPVEEPVYRKATTEEWIHYRNCTDDECPQQFRFDLMVEIRGDDDDEA